MASAPVSEGGPEAERILESLDPQQRAAVVANDRPLVVFAGAGSGKTRVITSKIAWAVKVLGIPAWRILAVTFTNRACKEMQERVAAMLGEGETDGMWIKTFHSFGAMVLRRFAGLAGLAGNFKIYDDEDSLALLQQTYPSMKRNELVPIAKRISVLKDSMVLPSDLEEGPRGSFSKAYKAYQEALAATGNVDFADLILRPIELADRCPEVASWMRNRFRMVLVDEYQDSNAAQCQLLRRVVGPECLVCVVGDDDQSIYRFRGAEVRNILSFDEHFPGARVMKLERNYRSTGRIVALASSVIGLNKGRASKNLFTSREDGVLPRLMAVETDYDEAQSVARILQRDGRYKNSAVLYRTNAQSAPFETVFNRLGVPYRIVGALRFYGREEVKDFVAYLSLLANPRDSVSFARIANKPPRGLGKVSMASILEASEKSGGDLVATCRAVVDGSSPARVASAGPLAAFLRTYDELAGMLGTASNDQLARRAIDGFGLRAYYEARDAKERDIGGKRVNNLEQIVNIIAEREDFQNGAEGLDAFMEEASLDPTMMASDDNIHPSGVCLMTMHNTKGLEFDRVFICGMEEGIIPSFRSESEADVEEERRLFYVAITRAKNELYILNCQRRRLWGSFESRRPSPFLEEIPKGLVAVSAARPFGQFGGCAPARRPSPAPSPRPAPAAAEEPLAQGDRIVNKVYGKGVVTAVRQFGERRIYDVRFDDGRRASFIAGRGVLAKA